MSEPDFSPQAVAAGESARGHATSRGVWQLAWPTILSYLMFTSVGFIQIKLVSELGTNSVAAITSGTRIFFLVQALLMGLSVASTAMISRAWGAGRTRQAEMVAWTTLTLSVAVAGVLSIGVMIFSTSIVGLFGLDAETTRIAANYVFYMAIFMVFSATMMILSSTMRATGDVITPLFFLFASSVLNVTLGYLLAFGIGPLPTMGVSGIALGGGIGLMCSAVAFFSFWWRGNFQLKAIKRAVIDSATARQLGRIGAPAVLEQAVVQLSLLLFLAIVANYGTAPFAAYGIGITLVSFSLVVGFGFGIATATLVGQQLGAGQSELAFAAVRRSLLLAVSSMVIFSLLLAWFAQDLANFMIDDPVVDDLIVVFIYFIALGQPIMAVEFTLAGALRGAGDTRFPLLATVCGLVFGRLLPAWLCLSLDLSVHFIFAVMLLDYTIKATLLTLRYRSRKWLKVAGMADIDTDWSTQ